MNKKFIFGIIGKSGAGKTCLEKILINKLDIKSLVLDTNREARDNEVEGREHFYKTSSYMQDLRENNGYAVFIEYGSYWYGLRKDYLDNLSNHSVTVLEASGYYQMKSSYKERFIPIYIDTSDKNRLLRSLTRETNPECSQIISRYLTDSEDFKDIEADDTIYKINNDLNDPNIAADKLLDYIKNIISNS